MNESYQFEEKALFAEIGCEEILLKFRGVFIGSVFTAFILVSCNNSSLLRIFGSLSPFSSLRDIILVLVQNK